LGKALLIGAALPNLGDWSIFVQLTHATYAARNTSIMAATAWITLIILLVEISPGQVASVVIEQIFGIMMDFALVLSIARLCIEGDKETSPFYLRPLIATTVHLFLTIFPLVWANFAVGQPGIFFPVNEMCVYTSVFVTHGIYMLWAPEFDKKANEKWDMPQQYILRGFLPVLLSAFTLAAIPIVIVPTSMTFCITPVQITGTSVGTVHPHFTKAFEERIHFHDLINKARKQNGNLQYHVLHNVINPDEYRFVETWDSKASLDAWLASSTVKETFLDDQVMKGLLVGGSLTVQGGYNEVGKIKPPFVNGAISYSVGSSCDKVWATISNWSDCSWVIGCRHAILDKKNPNIRVMHMVNEARITDVLGEVDPVDQSLVHTIQDSTGTAADKAHTGHKGEVDLSKTEGNHCDIAYSFESPGIPLEDEYRDFYQNRIPLLQKKWKD